MISKKEAVTLGLLAIGGVGAAMVVTGAGTQATPDIGAMAGFTPQGRAGGILGSAAPVTETKKMFQVPAQATVTFPKAPTFDITRFLAPQVEDIGRGAAGVSAAPKPKKMRPYIYTGGEIKPGAVSVAPWAMGRTTPTEIGVTTALSLASKPKTKTTTKKKDVPTSRKATPGRMGYSKAAKKAGFA